MKKWEIINKKRPTGGKNKAEEIVKILLENRGIKTKKEIEGFLNPKLEAVNAESVGVDKTQLAKAVARIKLAIKNKEQIVVFGDYDVDGVMGSAILWEKLNSMGAKVMPYIPHRIDEGYGLSIKGIENLLSKIKNCRLIITVDNGIVANSAVDFANENKINVIITDHHVKPKKLPDSLAIVHTTKLCGAGAAWILSQEIKKTKDNHLELVALATVADLVPLKGANRTLLKFGLEMLRKTKRIGLLELLKEAGLTKESLGVYEMGHIVAPRLNAMGRLEYAMDSLRLICTTNLKRAKDLAQLLGNTNKERQDITLQTMMHAVEKVKNQKSQFKSLLFIVHESYEQGVIGLVAGKLVEEFYRPAIVISKGEKFSKASARSISGFNMIDFIRSAQEFLVDAGGHPMAAGFTVETKKLPLLQKALEDKANLLINEDLLTRNLKIDMNLSLSEIKPFLFESLQRLSPFGMGNPEPTFVSSGIVEDMRLVGADGKHLKLKIYDPKSGVKFGAIGFGFGENKENLNTGNKINIVYTIAKDSWSGDKQLQLKLKDFRKSVD